VECRARQRGSHRAAYPIGETVLSDREGFDLQFKASPKNKKSPATNR
jgi:hypothetical protein